ncbi:MAG: zf-HC2 domain-containing protein [Clostridiales bacterium]|nr:zf-HC2 domain-containing protein [Clostridiales bacterium]
MKLSCDLIRDLLPAYVEGDCSADTKTAVEEHLAQCEGCRACCQRMGQPIADVPTGDGEAAALRTYAFKVRRHKVRRTVAAAAAVLVLAVLGTVLALTLHTMAYQRRPLVYELKEGIWNLTEEDLTTTAGEVGEYTLFTNYAQIVVTVDCGDEEDGVIYLYTDGSAIREYAFDGASTAETCIDGLTSAQYYQVQVDGVPEDALVTVSEGRKTDFLSCLLLVLEELAAMATGS